MPTLKQIALARMVAENRGARPITQLMKEAGYSAQTARTHQKQIQQGLGFIEVLEAAGATNKFIAKGLISGAKAMNGKRADHAVRHRFFETIMKAKRILGDNEGTGLGLIAEYLESLKGFDVQMLLSIKSRIAKVDNVSAAGG